MRCIRILIADRHPMILQGLGSVLGAQRDFRIVARCGDGASCVNAIHTLVPDVAIVDSSMLDIAEIKKIFALANSKNRATRLVFFSASVENHDHHMFAAAGAYAVISKDVTPQTLLQILRQVVDDEGLLSLPASAQSIVHEQGATLEKALIALTVRERQIMHLVSQGLTNKEIGRRLNIADGTIKVHLHHIFQKLDVGNRTALAALAISQNDNMDSARGNRSAGQRNGGSRPHG
jgi:two-component system, NarL family, nitrate/nitrite response regulator NarL